MESIREEYPQLSKTDVLNRVELLMTFVKTQQDNKAVETLKILLHHFTRKTQEKEDLQASLKTKKACPSARKSKVFKDKTGLDGGELHQKPSVSASMKNHFKHKGRNSIACTQKDMRLISNKEYFEPAAKASKVKQAKAAKRVPIEIEFSLHELSSHKEDFEFLADPKEERVVPARTPFKHTFKVNRTNFDTKTEEYNEDTEDGDMESVSNSELHEKELAY
mmetsp:Transcript_24893/g.28574  ORF Transcript_24893/g.28574 Transcript_24893/m.28574 type:complete len:221 (+) Transcript_24893:987-1649(+)|eukprot:CAMPEP_0168319314 /NCGR_PEP_ID=MMETSP0213-20121227/979_1 /TAXON_ID=151035 /ORGANISM="Euplotes harpa, Strain FSP1.4" /LENGTH=220 /DNA_ID=CAMNT_0008320505 /DNA_START=760 /DNA_END=1422 /DNA_ORIENTATION=+